MGKNHNLRNKSKSFRKEHSLKKLLMWGFQGGKCGICGEGVIYPPNVVYKVTSPVLHPTEEHVYPISKFQDRVSWGNIVLAHRGCNSKKQDRMPTGCELIWLEVVNVKYAEYVKRLTRAA